MTYTNLQLSQIIRSASFQFRTETDQTWVDELVEKINEGTRFEKEDAPKVALLDGSYYLYDGFHRTTAVEKAGLTGMEFQVKEVETEYEIMVLAIRANTKHGKRNSAGDYQKMCSALLASEQREQFLKNQFTVDTKKLAETIGCTTRHVQQATAATRESMQKDMDEFVIDAHLDGLSVKAIADEIGCSRTKVQPIVDTYKTEVSKNEVVPKKTPDEVGAPVVPTVTVTHDTPADNDFDAPWGEDGEDFSLTNDELYDGSTDDIPFDIDETDAAKLVSAVDAGDEVDTKDKEAVALEEKQAVIRQFMQFIPEFETGLLEHLVAHIQGELSSR